MLRSLLFYFIAVLCVDQIILAARLQQQLSISERRNLTRDDLLIVIPASTERLHLVRNTRIYRKGIKTFIVTERIPQEEINRLFPDPKQEYKEKWTTYREVLGEQKALPGDLRAAIAPFLAAEQLKGQYKWILYGDDDTLWVIDNLLRYLETLDEDVPYMLSDALWFLNKGPPGSEQHHSWEAPRCLPCNYTDRLIDLGQCQGYIGEWKWAAPVACPCTPEVLCRADNLNAFWPDTCSRTEFPMNAMKVKEDEPWAPRPGFWYMQHGGAGTVLSRGLMARATFEQVEEELAKMWKHSGDAMMFEIVWNLLGIGPTAPGYSFCRGYTSFDPGFYFTDLGGSGGDPLGVIERLESLLMGTDLCNASCADQMHNTLTVHIRSRFTNFSIEWLEANPTVPTATLLKNFMEQAETEGIQDAELGARLSKFFMERLHMLFNAWLHPEWLQHQAEQLMRKGTGGSAVKGVDGNVTAQAVLMRLLREGGALEEQQAPSTDDIREWVLTSPSGTLWLLLHGVGIFVVVLIMELLTGWGLVKVAQGIHSCTASVRQRIGGGLFSGERTGPGRGSLRMGPGKVRPQEHA